jgi:hypothetical protein
MSVKSNYQKTHALPVRFYGKNKQEADKTLSTKPPQLSKPLYSAVIRSNKWLILR